MEKKQPSTTTERPPIITVMGHVDHGKSTLLDYIRKTNTVDKESGGITQHLSAYEVEHLPAGQTGKAERGIRKITFLDTPGHAAFSQMRSRGAAVADIAILVVSAEDGVQMQTREALSQIQEAGIPYVVAITKIDKPNANIEKAKGSLLENGIYIEGRGGDTPCVEISAKSGKGVDDLLDMILLVADLKELTGNPKKAGTGIVIEAHVDPKRGNSATLIITDGTMKKGQFIVAEESISPIRAIESNLGAALDEASFSTPVRIIGFDKVPVVGSTFTVVDKKKEAEELARSFTQSRTAAPGGPSTEESGRIVVPVILKTDVLGTLEAIEGEIEKLSNEYVRIKVIQSGVGDISENDLKLASGAEHPIVIGFHVRVDKRAASIAERLGTEVQIFDIIYKLTEWLALEIERRIPKEMKEEIIGRAHIIRVFSEEKQKQVLGARVSEGVVTVKSSFRIIRRGNTIGEGTILELQHQKARVSEVAEGKEFGLMTESKMGIARGDTIEFYVTHG